METEGMGYGRKEGEVCRTEFIDMSPLSTDSGSHVAALWVWEGSYSWFSYLAETGTKRWPITGELEMASLPWSKAQGYRMSEWICRVRSAHPEDPLTTTAGSMSMESPSTHSDRILRGLRSLLSRPHSGSCSHPTRKPK